MSGLEIIAIAGVAFSTVSTICNAIYNTVKTNRYKKSHKQLLEKINEITEGMKPKDTPQSTPQESDPYEYVQNVDDYREMKPYYNVKTGKTEYFMEAPQSARIPVPQIQINKH